MLKEIVRRHGEVHRTKSKKRAEVNIYPEHIGLPGGPTLSADRGRSADRVNFRPDNFGCILLCTAGMHPAILKK